MDDHQPVTGSEEPKIPVCRTCGGVDVLLDAWAIWSVENQVWELGATFDNGFCNTCNGETRFFEWISIEEHRRLSIQKLNDKLRLGQMGPHDRIVATNGVSGRGLEFVGRAVAIVRTFSEFTEDNDPHGEHYFGIFALDGITLYFKIDYYDLEMVGLSSDPADPGKTSRVLTILEASEY